MKGKLTRQERSWILYDVGNSAFTLLISTIMPIYFNALAEGAGLSSVDYLAYWGYAASIATLLVAVSGPILGAVSDRKGRKKPLFLISILVGAVGCLCLGLARQWLAFLTVFVVARIGYSISLILYDSMLTDITDQERMDDVSSQGYAWGYIGSCIPFLICLALVLGSEFIGISMTTAMTLAFLVVAVWWVAASLPLLRAYRQRHYIQAGSKAGSIGNPFAQLGQSLKEISRDRSVFLFVIAFFFYIDGVYTIIDMATAYGSSLGLDTTGLLLALLVTQIVAFPSAIVIGRLARRVSSVTLISICIVAYFGIAVLALFLNNLVQFWILAVLVGMFQGGIQALSRSHFAKLIPAAKSGEYFGLLDICGKGASLLGTTVVSLIAQATGSANLGVGAIAIFFLVGLVFFRLSASAQRSAASAPCGFGTAEAAPTPEASLHAPEAPASRTPQVPALYRNRELSWLKFNQRVLEEGARETVPLCERLSFVSIYQSNLDEFFMVRVGSLVDELSLDQTIRENKTHMTSQEQLDAILEQVARLNARKEEIYAGLMAHMAEQGVRLVDFHTISPEGSQRLEAYFTAQILPLLSPVVVGRRQRFPFLRNKEIYAAAVLERKAGKVKIGIVPCAAGVFPRLIDAGGDGRTFMLAEELILHFLPQVFPGYHIKSKSLIRVTRNADIDADALYDEDLDYREFMADLMKKRRRLAPVRLELSRALDDEIIDAICRQIDIGLPSIFRNNTPLDLSFLFQLQDTLRQRQDLFYPKRTPQKSGQFRPGEPVMPQIREKDKLLCFPFERIQPFISLLREAAADPMVVSIKITLYRVARRSEIIEALIEAAENGKDVLALVELKARFDEENNIEWSRRLEEAGCSVIYGLNGYKVHSKLCLITRKGEEGTEYYTQVGTGNYNEKTARQYTDLSMMTCDDAIGRSAAAVFQALAMGDTVEESEALMVAPHCLQNKVLALIDGEIGRARRGEPAYIGVKINSLTDKKIIDRLIEASRAGVTVDLVVRGICCLVPGVPGETDHIRVVSIVGRFLEHSRIYLFGAGERRQVYIASADFMTRNTLRRVEVAAPVLDGDLRAQINAMFETMLRDNCQAWEMTSTGDYVPVPHTGTPINAQELFYQAAYDQAPQRPALSGGVK